MPITEQRRSRGSKAAAAAAAVRTNRVRMTLAPSNLLRAEHLRASRAPAAKTAPADGDEEKDHSFNLARCKTPAKREGSFLRGLQDPRPCLEGARLASKPTPDSVRTHLALRRARVPTCRSPPTPTRCSAPTGAQRSSPNLEGVNAYRPRRALSLLGFFFAYTLVSRSRS